MRGDEERDADVKALVDADPLARREAYGFLTGKTAHVDLRIDAGHVVVPRLRVTRGAVVAVETREPGIGGDPDGFWWSNPGHMDHHVVLVGQMMPESDGGEVYRVDTMVPEAKQVMETAARRLTELLSDGLTAPAPEDQALVRHLETLAGTG